MLPNQTVGNYITVPIKARIGGTAVNHDVQKEISTQGTVGDTNIIQFCKKN